MSAKVITIDGPAASGKTTVSRALGATLGWDWVSTGAFYRGLAFVADQERANLDDPKELVQLAKSDIWTIRLDEDLTRVFLHGRDVSEPVYSEEVGQIASKISHFPEVREALLEAQRRCGVERAGLVAEGRDCGTVVFPTAIAKIYLTARSEDRAKRRADEQGLDHSETIKQQQIRDEQDSTRKSAPLSIPEGAKVIDTSELSLDEVVAEVLSFSRNKLGLI